MTKKFAFRGLVSLTALLAGCCTSAAFAGELPYGWCDSEVEDCGPPPPPPAPDLPAVVSTNGNYRIALGTIRDSQVQEGYYRDGETTYFGGGPFHPVGGAGTLTVTGLDTSITLSPTLTPLAAVTATASATPA